MIEILMHEGRDTVGVAVVDIKAGQQVGGRSLHGSANPKVKALMEMLPPERVIQGNRDHAVGFDEDPHCSS